MITGFCIAILLWAIIAFVGVARAPAGTEIDYAKAALLFVVMSCVGVSLGRLL